MALSFFMVVFDSLPVEEKLCYDNSIPRDQSSGSSVCMWQAIFLAYCPLAICLSWLAQAIDLYLTVVKGVKGSLDRYYQRYMALIFIYPAFATIILGCFGYLGYNGLLTYCAFASSVRTRGIDLIFSYLPIFLIMITGTCLCAAVLAKIVNVWFRSLQTKRRVEASDKSSEPVIVPQGTVAMSSTKIIQIPLVVGGPREASEKVQQDTESSREAIHKTWKKKLKGTTSLVAFLLLFLVVVMVIFIYRIHNMMGMKAAKRSTTSWQRCIYENYDGVSDSSWQSVCGDQPEYYKHGFIKLYFANLVLVAGEAIVVCIPFLRGFFIVCKKTTEEVVDREIVRILQIRQSMIRRGAEGEEEEEAADADNK
jgi:hypothetical protein